MKGSGVDYDYGKRIYDARISRFLSVDPIYRSYPQLTTYQYASNRPVDGIDLDGLEFMPGTYDYKNAFYIGNLTTPTNQQLSQQEIETWGDAMNKADRMGKLAGLGLTVDLFTGGRVSNFFFLTQLYGTFEHNKAKTPEAIAAQSSRIKESLSNTFLTYGWGKLLEVGFISTKNAIPLFRGTSVDFAGNRALQVLNVTPTSTDPVVATIFATESEGYGEGVVYLSNTEKLSSKGVSKNVLQASEKEIVVNVSPSEFPSYATGKISAKDARGILKEMGINIPSTIKKGDIDALLERTRKLSAAEINKFIEKAKKISK